MDGFSLQATNNDQLFGHNNHFVVGTSFDYSVTRFGASAELGTIGTNYVVSGSGVFLGQSGDPAELIEHYGMGATAIEAAVRRAIARK